MRKSISHRLARLTVRHDGGEFEVGMPRDETQQLPSYVARAAQNDGGYPRRAHDATPAFTPIASITRSPSAAPSVIALNAATPIWVLMMSTPTALSVAGPVTTQGS